jgi:DNA-directed RNA polymerase beta subunit
MIMEESDMPFTAKGLRPDLILNPHAIPSRMTTGQMLETMSARIGTTVGTLVDSTPFCAQNQVEEYRDALKKLGFGHPLFLKPPALRLDAAQFRGILPQSNLIPGFPETSK